jgi:hypothetical protein
MNKLLRIASTVLAVAVLSTQVAQAQAPQDRKPKPPVLAHLPDYVPGMSTELINGKVRFAIAVYDMQAAGRVENVDVAGFVYTDGTMDVPTKHTKATFDAKVAFNGANGYYFFELSTSQSVRVCVWVNKKGHIDEIGGGDANNLKCLIFVVIQLDQTGLTRTASYLAYANEPKPSDVDHYYGGMAHWLPISWTKDVTDLSTFNVRSGEWLQMLPGSAGLWYSHEYVLITTAAADAAGWYVHNNRWYLR